MKNFRLIPMLSLSALCAFGVQSCSDDEGDSYINGTTIDVLYKNASINEPLNFSLGAGFQMIAVDCDGDWTATVSDPTLEYNPSDSTQLTDISRWICISNHAGAPTTLASDSTKNLSWIKVSFKYNESEDRSADIVFTSGNVSKTITINQYGAGADPGDFFETAYLFRENLKVGYNLGNTLDADPQPSKWFKPKDDLDYETSWGQPVTTPEIINTLVERGFNVIRIPVTWFPHMEEDGTVRELWMNRVQEVVDYVINSGAYCILNVQHDTGARNGRTDGAGWIKADIDVYETTTVKFQYLWKQIAERFRDYDEHLLFEAFNEILDDDDEWGDPAKTSAFTAITKLEQDFVDVVRATGGNNEYRNLVVNTYGAGHTQKKLDNFQVPQDKHRGHLLASIHSYDPYNFCNNNDEWNIYVFDDACKKEIDEMFSMINNAFNNLGIPYIYGEFGAIDDEEKEMGERVKYAQYMTQKFQDYGTTGLWWMGLFDRNEMEWYEPEIVSAIMAPYEK